MLDWIDFKLKPIGLSFVRSWFRSWRNFGFLKTFTSLTLSRPLTPPCPGEVAAIMLTNNSGNAPHLPAAAEDGMWEGQFWSRRAEPYLSRSARQSPPRHLAPQVSAQLRNWVGAAGRHLLPRQAAYFLRPSNAREAKILYLPA